MDVNDHLSDSELKQFLFGQTGRYSSLVEHIEQCNACEKRLDELVQKGNFFSEVQKLCGKGTSNHSAQPPANVKESLSISQKDRFQIQGEIARGGMGVIHRAKDHILQRDVALKVINPKQKNSDAVSRFVQEARISGMLQHPGIIPIHDLGLFNDDQPFLAMKLIGGQTLAELIGNQTPVDELLEIFAQVCQAVAYAHSKDVIHRDLKPINIMVGEFGEVQVMDWGLAKFLNGSDEFIADGEHQIPDEATSESDSDSAREIENGIAHQDGQLGSAPQGSDAITEPGAIIGTLTYMPPEQALGDISKIDKQTDVFALGAILCEILTGRPPSGMTPKKELLKFAQDPDFTQMNERLENASIDEELKQLVRISTAPEKSNRLADAGEISNAMIQWRRTMQKRFRDVEIEIAKTEAKAVVEMQKRRLAKALVFSLFALVSTFAIGYALFSYQKSVKLAEEIESERDKSEQNLLNNQAISRHLSQASLKRSAAMDAKTFEPEVWNDVLHEVELGSKLVNEDTDSELTKYLNDLMEEIKKQVSLAKAQKRQKEQLQQTMKLFGKAEQIHFSVDDNNSKFAYQNAADSYAKAFDYFGFKKEDELAVNKKRFLEAPADLQEVMVYRLYHWYEILRNKEEGVKPDDLLWVESLFCNLDDNAERMEIRKALISGDDSYALEQLELPSTIDSLTYLLLCSTLETAERYSERRRLLEQAVFAYPDSFWINFLLAQDYLDRDPQLIESALRHFHVCAALQPNNIKALINVGGVLIRQGKYDQALAHYERLVEIAPEVGQVHANLGSMLMTIKKYRAATERLKRAVELSPDIFQAYVALGQISLMKGKMDEANEYYAKAIEIEPECADAYVSMANVHNMNGDFETAQKSLDEVLQFAPDHPQALSLQAEVFARTGNLPGAMKIMKRVVKLSPQDIGNYLNLSNVQISSRDFDGALETLKAAEQLHPDDFRIYKNFKWLYEEMDEPEKAKEADDKGREMYRKKRMETTSKRN